MKKKMLLDIDEVLCFSGYLELVNEFLGTNCKIDDFTDYYIDEVAIPPEKMRDFNNFISSKNQYENPTFLPGAIENIIKLSEYYDIYPCSDCRNPFDLEHSGKNFANKFDLLYRTIPQLAIPAKNYILTGTKGVFNMDIQIDDLISNLESNIPVKILFPSYHNKNITEEELRAKNIITLGCTWETAWDKLGKMLMPKFNNYDMEKQFEH